MEHPTDHTGTLSHRCASRHVGPNCRLAVNSTSGEFQTEKRKLGPRTARMRFCDRKQISVSILALHALGNSSMGLGLLVREGEGGDWYCLKSKVSMLIPL
jgi:hypothetical protein